MRVGDCMTKEVVSLRPEATMREAVMLQRRHQIRHIPVVEGASLVGIVTDRDIRRAAPSLLSGIDASEYDAVLDGTPIAKIMTRDPLTATPDANLIDVVRLLVEKKVGGLPVVHAGRLVGIFTAQDALKVLLQILARVPQ